MPNLPGLFVSWTDLLPWNLAYDIVMRLFGTWYLYAFGTSL